MRGTGKTTMMLQYAKEELPFDESTIYISLDDIYFTANHLVDTKCQHRQHQGNIFPQPTTNKPSG